MLCFLMILSLLFPNKTIVLCFLSLFVIALKNNLTNSLPKDINSLTEVPIVVANEEMTPFNTDKTSNIWST